VSRSTTLPSPWREMAERAGGVAALAAELGVGVSTVRSWGARTRTPGVIVQRAVNAWARRRGIAAPWATGQRG
jgi:transposase